MKRKDGTGTVQGLVLPDSEIHEDYVRCFCLCLFFFTFNPLNDCDVSDDHPRSLGKETGVQ